MRKLFLICIFFFFNSTLSFADENKCIEFKKFSKEFIKCNVKKLKEASSKKTQELKEGTSKKAKELKENLVEIGDKVKNKIKKKE